MINISTVPENRQGSLKLHYATLPPNENPIKLDTYPHPIQGGFMCKQSPFSSKVRQHHTESSILSLPYWPNFLTGWMILLVGKGKRVAGSGQGADGCLVVSSVAEP